jgi:hypothetical protein
VGFGGGKVVVVVMGRGRVEKVYVDRLAPARRPLHVVQEGLVQGRRPGLV